MFSERSDHSQNTMKRTRFLSLREAQNKKQPSDPFARVSSEAKNCDVNGRTRLFNGYLLLSNRALQLIDSEESNPSVEVFSDNDGSSDEFSCSSYS